MYIDDGTCTKWCVYRYMYGIYIYIYVCDSPIHVPISSNIYSTSWYLMMVHPYTK